MTNEIIVRQEQLPVAKNQLSYGEAWEFIDKAHVTLAKSRAIGMTPEQAAFAMLAGYELGLTFTGALRVLYVSKNGQLTLKPKGALALMRTSGQLEKFDYEGDDTRQTVTIKRKGQPERSMTLTIDQAQKAGWKSQAWTATPSNMLRWRLIGWLADLEFTEFLLGLPLADDSWLDVELTPDGDAINPPEWSEVESVEFDNQLVKKWPVAEIDDKGNAVIKGEFVQAGPAEEKMDIPNYGINNISTLLEKVSDRDILEAFDNAFPVTPEDVNLCVHRLIEAGKLESSAFVVSKDDETDN